MADFYAIEYVGQADGTANPPKKLDGALVGSKHRSNRAVKPATILNIGDRLYIGQVPPNMVLSSIAGTTDTTMGTTTLSIGTTAVPAKYVNGKTLTVTDVPTPIGPRATAAVLPASAVAEDLWLTVGTAAIAAATIASFLSEYKIAS